MDRTEFGQRPFNRKTFTYRLTPPDAGTFWQHPHASETAQLEKRLYGALIVRAADELALDPHGGAAATSRQTRDRPKLRAPAVGEVSPA
jgi:FtsP/CotA-like multicopper oxidase with cupredoxin domain